MSARARGDMRILAHIKNQYAQEDKKGALGTYGRPRMMAELKEIGLGVGERRVGRLMRINGIALVCTPILVILAIKLRRM